MAISAVALRDSIALKAAVLPMLIRDMMMVKIHVKITELTGTCHLGWTYLISIQTLEMYSSIHLLLRANLKMASHDL